MKKHHSAALLAAITAAGALAPGVSVMVTPQSGVNAAAVQVTGARVGGPLVAPAAPADASQSNVLAKLLRMGFHRHKAVRPKYQGVRTSVAQGKRNAVKARNRQRHKKQWKAHVR